MPRKYKKRKPTITLDRPPAVIKPQVFTLKLSSNEIFLLYKTIEERSNGGYVNAADFARMTEKIKSAIVGE